MEHDVGTCNPRPCLVAQSVERLGRLDSITDLARKFVMGSTPTSGYSWSYVCARLWLLMGTPPPSPTHTPQGKILPPYTWPKSYPPYSCSGDSPNQCVQIFFIKMRKILLKVREKMRQPKRSTFLLHLQFQGRFTF